MKQWAVEPGVQEQMELGLMLPLMETFYTVQGEGAHTGRSAWFIRLGGCDVGCHWCDVKESWDASLHPLTSLVEIVEGIDPRAQTVVVTGGEPLLWKLDPLTEALKSRGLAVHIETSGAHPFSGQWDWICLSPKKFQPPVPEAYALAQELKVIVYHKSDLAWAEEHAARVGPGCALFLQPEWSRRETVAPLLVEYVQERPQWRISIQTHKYLRIP
ncbi:radical SAM protein [bacterium]|nr:radical SAM protein [bacterium]